MKTIAFVVLLVPSLVWAKPTGIAGYSGAATKTCNNCHNGGAEPVVTLEGPEQLVLGESSEYTLSIVGGAAKVAGLGINAGGAGVELVPGEGMKLFNGDLTHSAALSFPEGSDTFKVRFTVKGVSEGALTLFAAGLSADGNVLKTNDRAGMAQKAVTVVRPASNPVDVDAGTPTAPFEETHGESDPLIDGVVVPAQGCSAIAFGQGPLMLLGLLGLALRRRR
jgi:hypothetical protein